MNTGQIISGIAHLGLVSWAILGGAFRSEPLPFEVVEVTAISAEEYAALMAPERAPEAAAVIDTPEPPEAGAAPALTARADDTPEMTRPAAAEPPPADAAPEAAQPAPPAMPEPGKTPPALQPPSEDVAVLLPETSPTPRPRPAPRVAPEPVARPEPDLRIDDVERQEIAPGESDAPAERDREATAREEAATEIVTEAERLDAAAPVRSLRPHARPKAAPPTEIAAPAPQTAPQTAPETAQTAPETARTAPETAPSVDEGAVEDAIAAALGGIDPAANRPAAGPPLTAGEKDALRVAVQQCWNVGSLSTEALGTTVVVTVRMTEDGHPIRDSIRMIGFSGGSEAAARQAFAAAQRAIIRCGARGFDLPAEKYDRWREIEMTFNPEKMRIK